MRSFSSALATALAAILGFPIARARALPTPRPPTPKPVIQHNRRVSGNAKRLAEHRQACLTAYAAKRALVRAGKGSNSPEGCRA